MTLNTFYLGKIFDKGRIFTCLYKIERRFSRQSTLLNQTHAVDSCFINGHYRRKSLAILLVAHKVGFEPTHLPRYKLGALT